MTKIFAITLGLLGVSLPSQAGEYLPEVSCFVEFKSDTAGEDSALQFDLFEVSTTEAELIVVPRGKNSHLPVTKSDGIVRTEDKKKETLTYRGIVYAGKFTLNDISTKPPENEEDISQKVVLTLELGEGSKPTEHQASCYYLKD